MRNSKCYCFYLRCIKYALVNFFHLETCSDIYSRSHRLNVRRGPDRLTPGDGGRALPHPDGSWDVNCFRELCLSQTTKCDAGGAAPSRGAARVTAGCFSTGAGCSSDAWSESCSCSVRDRVCVRVRDRVRVYACLRESVVIGMLPGLNLNAKRYLHSNSNRMQK